MGKGNKHRKSRTTLHENLDRTGDDQSVLTKAKQRERVRWNPGVEDDESDYQIRKELEGAKLRRIQAQWKEVKNLTGEQGLSYTIEPGLIVTATGLRYSVPGIERRYLPDFKYEPLFVTNSGSLRVTWDRGYEATRREMPAPDKRVFDGEHTHDYYVSPRLWTKAKHALHAHMPSLFVGDVPIRNIQMPKGVKLSKDEKHLERVLETL